MTDQEIFEAFERGENRFKIALRYISEASLRNKLGLFIMLLSSPTFIVLILLRLIDVFVITLF